ncbi:MAG: hypothetical protein ACYTF6_08290 [Planctomycetota bacterium]|jgi:hypothetical protein
MRKQYLNKLLAAAVATLATFAPAGAQTPEETAEEKKDETPKKTLPGEFAIVFSFGYGEDDLLPKDKEKYEQVVETIKAGGFNTIMGTYADWKVEICKKHGMKFMVNLLTKDYHVYHNVEGARKLCESLRDNETIWGYHLYSDMNYKIAKGRDTDMKNVNLWDPTHPSFVGSYKCSGNSRLTDPSVFGYYDYQCQRGLHRNFRHLAETWPLARQKRAYFYRWMYVRSGLAGKGNPNRCLYTANTSIAFGLKGIMWFLATDMMDRKTWEWSQWGKDICEVNAEIAPLAPELMKIGHPAAVYSTPTTKDQKNREKAENAPPIPPPLKAIPEDHWLQVESGEAVLGFFQYDRQRDAIFLANHNAYAEQEMVLKFAVPVDAVSIFDREQADWRALTVSEDSVSFKLAPAGGELLRVERKKDQGS